MYKIVHIVIFPRPKGADKNRLKKPLNSETAKKRKGQARLQLKERPLTHQRRHTAILATASDRQKSGGMAVKW